jgi:hypothetical protein
MRNPAIVAAKSRRFPPAVIRALVSTGLGAVFGLQAWGLAKFGLGVSTRGYGPALMVLSHALMGLSAGASSGRARWWLRGLVLGPAFAAVSVFAAQVPAAAAISGGLVTALLIALLADNLMPCEQPASARRPDTARRVAARSRDTAGARRLREAKTALDRLETERRRRRNPGYGKAAEERIVWGELLELELQEIDEQVSRIRRAAGRDPDSPSS